MKKKLVIAALMTLLLTLVVGSAMAADCTNHNWTEWAVKDGVTHSRHCQNEGCYATEYEDHYGGKATCCSKALCEVCGRAYGKATGVHEWEVTSTTDRQHTLTCPGCQRIKTEYHSGGTATCGKKAECTICGTSYGSLLPMHSFDYDNAVVVSEATCEKGTVYAYTCKVCGAKETGVADDKKSCVLKCVTIYSATCTQKGLEKYICVNCGKQHGSNVYTGPIGHILINGRIVSDNTCVTPGTMREYCANCDYYEDSEIPANPGKHSYGPYTYLDENTHVRRCKNDGCTEALTDRHSGGTATCTTGALCAVCGHEYTKPLGHDMGSWKRQNETHDIRRCSKCDYFETTPHNFSKTVSLDAEKHGKKCSICGVTSTEKHSFVETVTQKANCEQGTVTTITCTGCDYTQTKIADDKQKHAYKTFTVKEPTCTAEGLIRTGCVNCGKILSEEATEPLGHTLLNDQVVANSNCCTPGILREYCTQKGCDYYEDTEIPVKPTMHDFGDWTYADGNSHARTCKNGCGAVETAAHSTKNPVCGARQVCDICGGIHRLWREHSYVLVETIPGTCEEPGKLVYECSACQKRSEYDHYTADHLVYQTISDSDEWATPLQYHQVRCETHNTAWRDEYHFGGTADENGVLICAGCGAKYYIGTNNAKPAYHYLSASLNLVVKNPASDAAIGTTTGSFVYVNDALCFVIAADGNLMSGNSTEILGTIRNDMLYDTKGNMIGLLLGNELILGSPDTDYDWSAALERYYTLHPELAPAE